MSSYKCIIVDDEPLICKLIQKLGNWTELNLEVVAVCYDGATAVRKIEELKPDIVLSDIKMPIYNGIQIIEQVNQLGLYPLFIIISGYSQFEYAQRAIQLKAVDYLVKPIHKDKLNDALQQCLDILDRQSKEHEATETLADIWKDLLWNDLYSGKYACNAAAEYREKYGTEWFFNKHYVACILLSRPELYENNALYVNSVFSILHSIFGDTLDSYDNSGSCIYFILSNVDLQPADVKKLFQKLFLDIKHLEDTLGEFSLTIGYSSSFTSPDGLLSALSQADASVDYRFEHGVNTIYEYDAIPAITCSYKSLLTESFSNQLVYLANNLSNEELSSSISELKSRFLNLRNRDYTGFKKLGLYIINTVMNTTHFPEPEVLKERFLFDYHFCTDYESCFSLILQYVLQVVNAKQEADSTELSAPIKATCDYIQQHFSEKIYLDDLAKNVCLSSTYLSAVFKKELGVNITEFVNTTRCNIAKDLLKTTSTSISQIAETIGYADEKYFQHQFKKIVGITPAQFRRIYA